MPRVCSFHRVSLRPLLHVWMLCLKVPSPLFCMHQQVKLSILDFMWIYMALLELVNVALICSIPVMELYQPFEHLLFNSGQVHSTTWVLSWPQELYRHSLVNILSILIPLSILLLLNTCWNDVYEKKVSGSYS